MVSPLAALRSAQVSYAPSRVPLSQVSPLELVVLDTTRQTQASIGLEQYLPHGGHGGSPLLSAHPDSGPSPLLAHHSSSDATLPH